MIIQLSRKSLYAAKEHLKEAKEYYRIKLSEMWRQGKKNTLMYKAIEERYKLTGNKIDRLNEKILKLS